MRWWHFTCPGPAEGNEYGHAIEAISATVRGGIHMASASISAGVDFTNATTSVFVDDPGNWPPRFVISGFTYDRFDQPRGGGTSPAWDHAVRCTWLSRQAAYDAGPYEQAARVFRQHGYTSGAKAILIAQRRHARRTISGKWALPRRALDTAFSVTVSYGYRPGRVLWLLAVLVVLYRLAPGAQCPGGHAGQFLKNCLNTPGLLSAPGAASPAKDDRLPVLHRKRPPMPAAMARSSASTRSFTPSTLLSRSYR